MADLTKEQKSYLLVGGIGLLALGLILKLASIVVARFGAFGVLLGVGCLAALVLFVFAPKRGRYRPTWTPGQRFTGVAVVVVALLLIPNETWIWFMGTAEHNLHYGRIRVEQGRQAAIQAEQNPNQISSIIQYVNVAVF